MEALYFILLGIGWTGILYTFLVNLFRLWVDPDGDFPRVNIPTSVKVCFGLVSFIVVSCLLNILGHIF